MRYVLSEFKIQKIKYNNTTTNKSIIITNHNNNIPYKSYYILSVTDKFCFHHTVVFKVCRKTSFTKPKRQTKLKYANKSFHNEGKHQTTFQRLATGICTNFSGTGTDSKCSHKHQFMKSACTKKVHHL